MTGPEDKSEEGGFRERVSDEIDELGHRWHATLPTNTIWEMALVQSQSGFGPWSGPCLFSLWTTDRLSGPVQSKISPVQAVHSL